jgi:hypothetical protein
VSALMPTFALVESNLALVLRVFPRKKHRNTGKAFASLKTKPLRDDTLGFRTRKRARLMKALAVVLVVIGIGIVIWGVFGFTTREKVVDVGPIHATKDKEHNVPYGSLAVL